jgi:hypothetical protein
MRSLALILTLPLVACVVGPEGDDGTIGGGSGSGSGSGSGGEGGISGKISASTQWSGAVLISGITTIDPGVTVTVAAGSTLTFKGVASLQVGGIFDVQGTSASPVTIKPETQGFNGINVPGGGEVKYQFVEQWGGGIVTNGSAKFTLVDTRMSRVAGDFLLMNGGTLDMTYSQVGLDAGEADTTHCDLHFGGNGNVIKVNHSSISTSSYGLMFYGGMNADFKLNNWFSNLTDVDTTNTSPVTGDFSNGWFEKGAPSGAGITAANLATTRLVDCDGTNDNVCAGPRP